MGTMTLQIQHEHGPTGGRFWAEPEPGLRCELDYQHRGTALAFTHTGVPPALEGRGLAGQLVRFGLDWAAMQALPVLALCSYVDVWMRRHPRYERLRLHTAPQRVLNFWFGALGSASDGQSRHEWFRKNQAFDDEIRAAFLPLIDAAIAGQLPDWGPSPWAALARIVLLDQFPRNIFRGEARAFDGDPAARREALQLMDSGGDRQLGPYERWFVALPLEHAEDLSLQQRCVAYCAALAGDEPALAGALDYAQRHRDVIARFGRFPHRNAVLGRSSTADELDYLAQPGAGF